MCEMATPGVLMLAGPLVALDGGELHPANNASAAAKPARVQSRRDEGVRMGKTPGGANQALSFLEALAALAAVAAALRAALRRFW